MSQPSQKESQKKVGIVPQCSKPQRKLPPLPTPVRRRYGSNRARHITDEHHSRNKLLTCQRKCL